MDLVEEIKSLFASETQVDKFQSITYSISTKDDALKCLLKPHFPACMYLNNYTTILITLNPTKLKIINSTIFIVGYYTKLSRVISQTPFKHASRSVSDFVIDFKEHYKADNVNFIGCGREDVDVHCYKRPFMLEIKNPKHNLYNHALTVKLNEGVSIFDLKIVKKEYRKIFLSLNPIKTYKATIKSKSYSGEINNQIINLKQKTPTRVLHRRTNMLRERNIEIIEVKIIKDTCEALIKADAGTYIKEFVSGDFGRTVPSLTDINGNNCICVSLDVIKIDCDVVDDKYVLSDVCITNI